jgi:hypothetical protein
MFLSYFRTVALLQPFVCAFLSAPSACHLHPGAGASAANRRKT